MHYVIEQIHDGYLQREIIQECDDAFADSVVNRNGFDALADKIRNNGIFLVIRVDNETAGYAALYANDGENKTAYISLICIKRPFQKMHLGKSLIEECCKVAKRSGMTTIRLEVNKKNLHAIQFYQADGFEKEAEDSEATFYMRKEL